MRHVLLVPGAAAGSRLDKFLADAIADLSRSRAARLVEEGQVTVNGRAEPVSRRVKEGERVECEVPEPGPGGLVAEERELVVLHEDAHVLALDKPAGLVVHPGAGRREGTLVHALLHHCGPGLLAVGGEGRPGIVHRLDKDTTGVMLVAKTPEAYRSLTAQFAARTVEKTYLALVHGSPRDAGRIEAPIGRSAQRRTRMAVVPTGRPALSEWRVRERFLRAAALLEVDLRTGRTHQARVHLAHAGHPLVGDAAYARGGAAPPPFLRGLLGSFGRPALHAWRLAVDHPATGERLRLEAPMPSDLAAVLDALRHACGAPH